MTPPGGRQAVRSLTGRFFEWLSNDALPLWATRGVDREAGGFVEQLTPEGRPIAEVRRARLVARQIFAFRTAGELGWTGPTSILVDHGLAALLKHHVSPGGNVVPRYIPAESRGEGAFDLYDQAFALFGLAHGHAQTGDGDLEARAIAILEHMRRQWRHPKGGFVEDDPARALLKANPHMHLLEASLAWLAVSTNDTWRALAAEIVDLCLKNFLDPSTGGLHEYFDTDWKMLIGPPDDVVEPGHQSEWAWLLIRWHAIEPDVEAELKARRLFAIAEGEGLDARQNRLRNELNGDLSIRDGRLRLWPQTERIKALVAIHRMETDPGQRARLEERLEQALRALLGYFDHPIAGSWWEHFDEIGEPIYEPARASSLYHIMGAASALAEFTGLRLG
jgi:mannose/cellobiose epimerase-like protein (N-acyl-D-glucosamine 2-epimerase family)